jgi:PAS domain S-box-containing protein
MPRKPKIADGPAELRRRAEGRLGKLKSHQRLDAGTQRLLHELEIHQIELEMQNAELHKARDELEAALENYADLYDFAPVGYFSLDESGVIVESNLTGASLLGIERSRLINRRLQFLVSPTSRPTFLAFLENVIAGSKEQECEALLLKEGGGVFWAGFRGTSTVSLKGMRKRCRVVFGDISVRKLAEETQSRLETMTDANRKLNREIARRKKVEQALQKSEQHQIRLLKQSQSMQAQLRHLSHEILHAQEEERKRISRELHDEIAQALVGINVHLEGLTREAAGKPGGLHSKIVRTQRVVRETMDIVHLFARELRPTVLDDLGLIPALHAFMNEFTERTGVRASLTVFAAIEQLDMEKRTVLYRVAHEALNNVARHAQASRVAVNIEKLPDSVSMKIIDNGKSFDVGSAFQANRGRRLGLLGMRERVEMVGGHFDVQSARGQGTTISAQIPLDTPRAQGLKGTRTASETVGGKLSPPQLGPGPQ